MKPLSVISTAAAVTFAAGIALAGPTGRAPAENRSRKEAGPARETARKGRNVAPRPPFDPTVGNPSLARALTSAGRARG